VEKLKLVASDGYVLHGLLGTPKKNVCGTIVISPATCIKKEYYLNFAHYLMRRGYTVVLFDYRGIGESAPPDLKQSSIYLHEWGTLDMNTILNFLVDKRGYRDIVWIGHSIGAQLVGFLENHRYIKQVIAVNAALGYWRYFPFPMRIVVWLLWYVIGPLMIRFYGYGQMKLIGWGENLPPNALLEWRSWCLSKKYFGEFISTQRSTDCFDDFKCPITAIYFSDDYIANDVTVPLMMKFFPNAPQQIVKIDSSRYTPLKVGHSGVFRKRFESTLWPVLVSSIHQ
jgi:predicted alpha/beta hydrolase